MHVARVLRIKGDDGVVTVPPGTLTGEAVRIMASRQIGAVVISADGQAVLGILTETDVVRAIGDAGMVCLIDPVETVMSAPVLTCNRRERVEAVMERMGEAGIRHMPVVERGAMVGLVSAGDLIRASMAEAAADPGPARTAPVAGAGGGQGAGAFRQGGLAA